ncbi:MAG TPA: hypothetical protein VK611_29855 [Acidimicrobiales bacterium]|nr:hypothetical protein [Acidimicrobiales bacterium]
MRASGWFGRVILAGAATVLVACVGSVTRDDLQEEVESRGGGLSQEVLLDAVAAVADDQGEATPRLRSVSVVASHVALEVMVPGTTEDLDAYDFGTSGMFGGRGLDGPEPVARSSTEESLESTVFTAEAAGLRRFDAMVDAALEEADLARGHASGATIARPAAGTDPQTTITVSDRRRTVSVTFGPDAVVVGVQR